MTNDTQTIEHRLRLIRNYIIGLAEDTKAIRTEIEQAGQSTKDIDILSQFLGVAYAAAEIACDSWHEPPADYEPMPEFEHQRVLSDMDADFAANAATGDRFK